MLNEVYEQSESVSANEVMPHEMQKKSCVAVQDYSSFKRLFPTLFALVIRYFSFVLSCIHIFLYSRIRPTTPKLNQRVTLIAVRILALAVTNTTILAILVIIRSTVIKTFSDCIVLAKYYLASAELLLFLLWGPQTPKPQNPKPKTLNPKPGVGLQRCGVQGVSPGVGIRAFLGPLHRVL